MANELTLTFGLAFTKTGATFNRTAFTDTITVSGSHVAAGTQAVGTSAEALGKGDITTPGYLLIHNMDSTNFVQIGYDDSGFKHVVKVAATEWALFRLSQSTPQVKADTSGCNIEYWLIEA
jgi:hypothetical protein